MTPSAVLVMSHADALLFLEHMERMIAGAAGFQWREEEAGNLSIWIQERNGSVRQTILLQDLAEEFRSHEGIRCAILDALADGRTKGIAGTERITDAFRLHSGRAA